MQKLQNELAVFHTAKNSYIAALKVELAGHEVDASEADVDAENADEEN